MAPHNKLETIKGQTTIYGEVRAAGGDKNPRATLKINDEYTISFDVKKNVAEQLAAHLYNHVGLKGTAKWDKNTYKILGFKVDSVIIIEHKSLIDTFRDLGKSLGGQINKQGD